MLRGHILFVPDLNGKALSFSSSMMLAMIFLYIYFYKVEEVLSIPSSLRVFFFNPE